MPLPRQTASHYTAIAAYTKLDKLMKKKLVPLKCPINVNRRFPVSLILIQPHRPSSTLMGLPMLLSSLQPIISLTSVALLDGFLFLTLALSLKLQNLCQKMHLFFLISERSNHPSLGHLFTQRALIEHAKQCSLDNLVHFTDYSSLEHLHSCSFD